MNTILEKRLYKNKINEGNFNSLLNAYEQHSEDFLAFLGAGMGFALRDVPDIEGLYKSMCQKYGQDEQAGSEWPELFEELYAKVRDKKNFDIDLVKAIIPKNAPATTVHVEIASAFNCFVTTNYYDPIEDGFKTKQKLEKAQPESLVKYYFVFPEERKHQKHSITYLHGSGETGFCILRKFDYEYFYPSLYNPHKGVYAIENSLCRIFENKFVVFLGSSLEKHLKDFMKHLLSVGCKESIKTHYLVTSDSALLGILDKVPPQDRDKLELKYFEDYENIHIKPILYSGGHIFIHDLCATMASKGKLEKVPRDTYNPGEKQGDL